MRGEPNSAMVLNTKRYREDKVARNTVAAKYLGTMARCHGGSRGRYQSREYEA